MTYLVVAYFLLFASPKNPKISFFGHVTEGGDRGEGGILRRGRDLWVYNFDLKLIKVWAGDTITVV